MSENTYDWKALAAPFDENDVKFKPGQHRENDKSQEGYELRAMAYVDARAIMDRLDEIIGQENWQDDYRELPNGSVECKISIRIGDHWIHKTDIGTESDYESEKGAYSDAFKRACVKLGLGRYLYSLPSFWWPARRVTAKSGKETFYFIGTPSLPRSPQQSGSSKLADTRPTSALGSHEKPATARGTVRPFGTVKELADHLITSKVQQKAKDTLISEGQSKNIGKELGILFKSDEVRAYFLWRVFQIEPDEEGRLSKYMDEKEFFAVKGWLASPVGILEYEVGMVVSEFNHEKEVSNK